MTLSSCKVQMLFWAGALGLVIGTPAQETPSGARGTSAHSNTTSGATTTSEYWDGAVRWRAGATLGIRANGRGIGVLSGTGRLDYSMCGAHVTGDATADGKGGVLYSNVTTGTTASEYWDGTTKWNAGAVLGVSATGDSHGIGVLAGIGKLDYHMCGAHVMGDVTATGKGGMVYSNVSNGTTTEEFWDQAIKWKAGAVLGIRGKGIGVISGTGKLDFSESGAHVTGDVTADGKAGLAYSNVVKGMTTNEYWDGATMWRAGAVLGIKGRGIGVIDGTQLK